MYVPSLFPITIVLSKILPGQASIIKSVYVEITLSIYKIGLSNTALPSLLFIYKPMYIRQRLILLKEVCLGFCRYLSILKKDFKVCPLWQGFLSLLPYPNIASRLHA